MSTHEHEYQGQKLRHSHPGGDVPHGYFEHPEDGHPYPAADVWGTAKERKARTLRFAAALGIDGEALYRATLAAWSNYSPACMPADFDRVLSMTGAALKAAAEPAPALTLTGRTAMGDQYATCEDYAVFTAERMNLFIGGNGMEDTEATADGRTVTLAVHQVPVSSATFSCTDDVCSACSQL